MVNILRMNNNNNNNNNNMNFSDASDPIPDLDTEMGYRELLAFLNESPDFRQAARSSLQQGLYSGGGAVAGGLILGPVGGLLGGIVGSIVGFNKSDSYDGVMYQLRQLPPAQQRKLLQTVAVIAQGAVSAGFAINSPNALHTALMAAASNRAIRDQVWQACTHAMDSRN
jgi:hypothetical protein